MPGTRSALVVRPTARPPTGRRARPLIGVPVAAILALAVAVVWGPGALAASPDPSAPSPDPSAASASPDPSAPSPASSAPAASPPAGDVAGPGLCWELGASAVPPEAWPDAVEALAALAVARPHLFPDPYVAAVSARAAGDQGAPMGLRVGIWDEGAGDEALAAARTAVLETVSCLEPGAAWTVRVTVGLLAVGAQRRAASVPLSLGTTATLGVSLFPDEERVSTHLEFTMPLGVGGRCWVDDTLGVDPGLGQATVTTELGRDVTLFGDYGCDRFLELMPDGGAGEQAIGLIPTQIALADGSALEVRATGTDVTDDALLVVGG